jgi:hypothetical protein
MTAVRGGLILAAVALALGGCNTPQRAAPFEPPTRAAPPAAAPAPSALGPVLAPDGTCTGPAPGTAAAIDTGIAECDLVRLKGKPPTDVLVGESGKGQREVQVLYNEPGGRELYFFTDNRLTRTVKPSAG